MKTKGIVKLCNEILNELGDDYDITECSYCEKAIVVQEAEMELPSCNSIECTAKRLNLL